MATIQTFEVTFYKVSVVEICSTRKYAHKQNNTPYNLYLYQVFVMYNAAYQTQVKSLPRLVLTWPSDASHIEPAGVIGLEERFHYSPLLLAFPADGAEQVLGIHLIPHPLETGDADQRQQNRYDDEVPWVTTHNEAQAVEGRV